MTDAPFKIMLLGGEGYIGRAVLQALDVNCNPEWLIIAYTCEVLDVTHHAAVREAVRNLNPHLIINTATLDDLAVAEASPDIAEAVNFHAVANLAAVCSTLDIPLLHLSTACVFDGQPDTEGLLRPYRHDDPMNPLNQYGMSMLMGEESIRHELAWHVILRTSWVFTHEVMPPEIVSLSLQDSEMIGSPTPMCDLVATIFTIVKNILDGRTDGFGTFHYCGSPPISARALSSVLSYDIHTSNQCDHTVQMPVYSALDCTKLEKIYAVSQPQWRDKIKYALLPKKGA